MVGCGCEQCFAVGDSYPQETTSRHPEGCARGGRPEDPSTGDRRELKPSGPRVKETYCWSCPKGTPLKFSAVRQDRGCQGN